MNVSKNNWLSDKLSDKLSDNFSDSVILKESCTGIRIYIIRVPHWVPDEVPDEVPDGVTQKEEQLLMLLLEDPGYTKIMLAEKMSLSRKTISKYLKSLKNK